MSKAARKIQISEIVLIALTLILTLGVKLAFHACGAMEDGSWMHCHQAENAVMGLGIAMLALSVVHLFAPRGVKLILDIAVIALAVVAFLVPGTLVSMCMMADMQCQAVMKPAARVLSALIAAGGIWNLIAGRRVK